jgi:hypothetical protein
MLEVRINHDKYRVTNATLDQVFGEGIWRRMGTTMLDKAVEAQHAKGRLVVDGRRLRRASPTEEAAEHLRTSESLEEIIRHGFICIAARLTELASDVRQLREQFEFDAEASNAPLARAGEETRQFQTDDGGVVG